VWEFGCLSTCPKWSGGKQSILVNMVSISVLDMPCLLFEDFSLVPAWSVILCVLTGKPPSLNVWLAQCCLYMLLMVIVKVCITLLIQLDFWDVVRDIILSPITNPKVEVVMVMLIIPFFINVSECLHRHFRACLASQSGCCSMPPVILISRFTLWLNTSR
jgi:hypothetical protein